MGGWTETKLMLSQLKFNMYLKLELSLPILTKVILNSTQVNVHSIYIFSTTSPGGWWVVGGWSDKTKVRLNSTQVDVEV